jgi:hypothetical protein
MPPQHDQGIARVDGPDANRLVAIRHSKNESLFLDAPLPNPITRKSISETKEKTMTKAR